MIMIVIIYDYLFESKSENKNVLNIFVCVYITEKL